MIDKTLDKINKLVPQKWQWILSHEGFRKYFKNTGWMFVGRIVVMVISFFVAAYVARYLGPENYGTLSYIISLVGIFAFLANLGIDSVIFRDLTTYPEKRDELLGSAFFLKIVGSIISVIVLSLCLLFLGNSKFINTFSLIVALGYIFQSFNVITMYFQSKAISKNIAISAVFVVLVLSALKIIFVIFDFILLYFVLLLFFEQVLYAISFVFLYEKTGKSVFNWKINKKLVFDIWKESIPLMFSAAFFSIYNRIDQIMIQKMLGASSVGIYDVAVRLSEFWYFIPGIMVASLLPAVINAKKTDKKNYHKRLWKLFYLVIGISFFAASVVFLFSKFIILELYGASYSDSVAVVNVYVWAGIAMSVNVLANQYLIIEKLIKLSFFANLIGALINIILNIFLIPNYGILGAAYATLISYISVLVFIFLFKKINKSL